MADATTLGIPESQQHTELSISHRSKRLKFVESSTGKLKLMDRPLQKVFSCYCMNLSE